MSPEASPLADGAFSLCLRVFPDVSSSSSKDTSPVGLGPNLGTHLTIITSLKTLSPKTVTLGGRV